MDDRDDSPERGEWNPDPEEARVFHLSHSHLRSLT